MDPQILINFSVYYFLKYSFSSATMSSWVWWCLTWQFFQFQLIFAGDKSIWNFQPHMNHFTKCQQYEHWTHGEWRMNTHRKWRTLLNNIAWRMKTFNQPKHSTDIVDNFIIISNCWSTKKQKSEKKKEEEPSSQCRKYRPMEFSNRMKKQSY